MFDLDAVAIMGDVADEPDWIFGTQPSRPGSVPLRDVRDAALLTDGRVAILNGVTEEVVLTEPGHTKWQILGGRGQGPGEFEFVASVVEIPRGLGVFDQYSKEWTTFETDEKVSSVRLPHTGVQGPYYPEVVFPLESGFMVGDAFFPPHAKGGLVTRRQVLIGWA